MIKAIFFDVDGTLISKSRSVLSEGVIAALKQLQKRESNYLLQVDVTI